MVDLASLLDDGGVRVPAGERFSAQDAERLGRALGTLALRRGQGRLRFVLARTGSADADLRDGLVRGLLLSGHDVADAGEVSEARWAAAAGEGGRITGAYLGVLDGGPRLRLMLGGGLSEEARAQLAAVFAAGDFSAGEGRLDALPA